MATKPGLIFHLPNTVNQQERKKHPLYPDVFDYQYDQKDYKDTWKNLDLSQGSNKLLIVDGATGRLNRVGKLRYYFERFCGFIGLQNDCQPEKIKMAVEKLGYYGYLNGFNTDIPFDAIKKTWSPDVTPQEPYFELIQAKALNPRTSRSLQTILISLFEQFFKPTSPIKEHFKFGSSYAEAKDYISVANLDVQDPDLIVKSIIGLPEKESGLKKTLYQRFCSSHPQEAWDVIIKNHQQFYPLLIMDEPISKRYARHLIEQAESASPPLSDEEKHHAYEQAVSIDSHLKTHEASTYFFNHYVEKQQWQNAFDLLILHRSEGLADDSL
ncbi:MAG: hypothetical protein ACOYOK_16290, partial [Pseudobdellovibrionaceae bacterium]